MSEAKTFRKKPVEIQAIQFTGEPNNFDEVCRFLGEQQHGHREEQYGPEAHILIYTLEGTVRADPGDWIIRDVTGEFYPCQPDIFEQNYEPVDQ
ncbi:hypothetical protein ACFORO_12495 [Amycolatopsis halotolerans]|uniref:Uncharacterized protein n=1 Tax=Amycolatopsis halotolerans TaxID=330083 RepID=A0ABV7QCI1_9PSEU